MKKYIMMTIVGAALIAGCGGPDHPANTVAPSTAAVAAKPMPIAELFTDTGESNMRAWCINGTVWLINSTSTSQMFEVSPSSGSIPIACTGGITFPIPKP